MDAISIDNLKKSFGNREVLREISFSVEKGDIFGFLGRNGAGKTTTIRILLGLYRADSGKAAILGNDSSSDEARRKVGFMLDGDGLYDNMNCEANLFYYLRIYGKPADKKRVAKVLELVGLSDRAKDKPGAFSKGMRQKLSLAKALVHSPEVLILDEPTSGLDPTAQIEFRNIMMNIAQDEKKTILLSSHNLDEVQRICNRIALLNDGQIQLCGQLDELRRQNGGNALHVQTAQLVSDTAYHRLAAIAEIGLKGRNGKSLTLVPSKRLKTSDVMAILANAGIEVDEISKNESSLEELYSSIVKEQ